VRLRRLRSPLSLLLLLGAGCLGAQTSPFRITPRRPIAELRAEALVAMPPVETGKAAPDLIDLTSVDARIRLDIRYATADNFMGVAMYDRATARLQRPAAEALGRVQQALAAEGLGLLVFDAYRPWYVTKMFWEATPDSQRVFVADPSRGSRHNRGAAVDLTLYDLRTGAPLPMPSGRTARGCGGRWRPRGSRSTRPSGGTLIFEVGRVGRWAILPVRDPLDAGS